MCQFKRRYGALATTRKLHGRMEHLAVTVAECVPSGARSYIKFAFFPPLFLLISLAAFAIAQLATIPQKELTHSVLPAGRDHCTTIATVLWTHIGGVSVV